MTPEEQAAKTAADTLAADEAAKKAAEDAAKTPPHDPLKEEAERLRKQDGRTELEKALYTMEKIGERIKELGGDPAAVFVEPPQDSNDDAPVTVGMLKKLEQERAAKSAHTLAEEQIKDDTELELVKHHLTNSIKPSGNALVDLQKARAIVNETKNRMIAEEATRKKDPQRNSKSSGAPGSHQPAFVPTEEEQKFMGPPWKLTQKQIEDARTITAKNQE